MKLSRNVTAALLLPLLPAGCRQEEERRGSVAAAAPEQRVENPAGSSEERFGWLPQSAPSESDRGRGVRQLARLKEAARHLEHACAVLGRIHHQERLVMPDGSKPDLLPLRQSLEALQAEIVKAGENAEEMDLNPAMARFRALFTLIFELEKQAVWPENAPERKSVAADIFGAGTAFDP